MKGILTFIFFCTVLSGWALPYYPGQAVLHLVTPSVATDTPDIPDTVIVTDTPSQRHQVRPVVPPAGGKHRPKPSDSLLRMKDSASTSRETPKAVYLESSIPPGEAYDTVLSIPFSLKTACQNRRNELAWDLGALDSLKKPRRLYLHYRPFVLRDSSWAADSLRSLDSSVVREKQHLWVVSGGVYVLSYFDKKNKVLYRSDELEVPLCAAYAIPEVFNLNNTPVLKPEEVNNIEKVDLTIFSSNGEEVFSTADPQISWDGRNKNSGLKCEPGNYFYNCDVWEKKGSRVVKRNITGVIELVY